LKILCIDTSSKICSVAILENTTLLKKIELDTDQSTNSIHS